MVESTQQAGVTKATQVERTGSGGHNYLLEKGSSEIKGLFLIPLFCQKWKFDHMLLVLV